MKSGFSMIELVASMAVILILFTFVSPIVRRSMQTARIAQARTEMQSIEVAVESFRSTYGHLPAPEEVEQGKEDTPPDPEVSRAIIATLSGENRELNPRGLIFLKPKQIRATGNVFLDPWGDPYEIALDTDYDGRVSILGESVARSVAIIAVGDYLRNGSSSSGEIVRSWR